MAMNARDVGVKSPCTMEWRKMTPADGGRFCGDCKKVVRDLSRMTEDEARTVLAKERHADLCVRMIVDRDGNVFFGANVLVAPSFLSRAKRVAAAAAAVALPLATQACTAVTQPLGITSSEQKADQDPDRTNDPDHYELTGGVSADNEPRPHADASADADAGVDEDASADAGGDADGGTDAAPDVTLF